MPNIYSTEKFEKEFTYSGSDLGATYTPENYNVPEGSYSTDPYNGAVRVSEMKQMVKTLHDNQISVIMDVVYNHVYNASDFCVNQIVPGYFSVWMRMENTPTAPTVEMTPPPSVPW